MAEFTEFICAYCGTHFQANPFADFCSEKCRKAKENHQDFEIEKVVGLDIEPEDRDVGIMSASFCLILKDTNGKQLQLYFDEERIDDLVVHLKPVINEMNNQIQLDKLLEKEK